MKEILIHLFEHKTLERSQAREILVHAGEGRYSEHELTAFITVFLMRSVTIEELQGFRDALLDLCVRVDLGGADTLDLVGTGGDGKNTFNISTLASFIVAGAGQPVAKHGNYGASSVSGSSNVMEKLGYRFKTDQGQLARELEAANICFLHAPLFHPALKAVAPIRKSLGLRTFFNMLGPMVNPAAPAYQLLGVFNLEMARVYTYMLQEIGQPFTVIHGLDGYDEISLTNETKVITHEGEFIRTAVELGKRNVQPEDIRGGQTVEESAAIFLRILKGGGTWAQNAVVLANAAMGLASTGKYGSYDDAYATAVESLDQGNALRSFEELMRLQ